ncbi:hypothetical protein GCM10023080_083890 [Streptomyces pseudoechinosporeus]
MIDGRSDVQVAAIKDLGGHTRGAGVLVAPNHILTCAHVVAAALGAPASGDRPRGQVLVQLPALPSDRRAEVVPSGWMPLREDGHGNLALLHLVEAAEDAPRTLPWERPDTGARVHVRLSPESPAQRWTGVVRHSPEPGSAEWARLEFTGTAPGPGGSGAPVWDSESGRVVGILVGSAAHGGDPAVGWMVSVAEAMNLMPVTGVQLFGRPEPRANRLTVRELGELVEALLAMPLDPLELKLLMSDLAARNPAVADTVTRHPTLRLQAVALVRACAQWPDGLRSLVTTLYMLMPGIPELEAFAGLVERMTAEPLLLPSERRQLHQLLASASVSTRPPDTTMRAEDLLDRAADLEDAAVLPGKPPALMEFVSEIAALAEPPVGDALRLWLQQTAARLGPYMLPVPPTRSSGPPWVLKFVLEEAAWDRTRFELSVWLLRGTDGEALPLPGSSEPLSLATVQALVRETLNKVVQRHTLHAAQLRIEFELPRQHLELPVERWPTGTRPHSPVLGTLYPVTVRTRHHSAASEERMTRWQELIRAGQLRSMWSEGGGRRVLCLGASDVGSTTCLSRATVWEAVLQTGAAVALWSRDGTAECDSRIEELAAHATVASLPETVLELRRDRTEWESIALLYDDPRSDLSESPPFPLHSP